MANVTSRMGSVGYRLRVPSLEKHCTLNGTVMRHSVMPSLLRPTPVFCTLLKEDMLPRKLRRSSRHLGVRQLSLLFPNSQRCVTPGNKEKQVHFSHFGLTKHL